jgi:hypothetical protein
MPHAELLACNVAKKAVVLGTLQGLADADYEAADDFFKSSELLYADRLEFHLARSPKVDVLGRVRQVTKIAVPCQVGVADVIVQMLRSLMFLLKVR